MISYKIVNDITNIINKGLFIKWFPYLLAKLTYYKRRL